MKTNLYVMLLLVLCGLWQITCKQNTESNTKQNDATESDGITGNNQAPANVQEQIAQAQKNLETLQGEHAKITPVNFRKLKELLPDRLLGLPRTKHTGESAGAMGMKFSTAEASYRDGQKRLTVKIVDAGGLGAATMSMAAWSMIEVDKESDEGYEKTSTWGNFKMYESCRTANEHCSVKLYEQTGIIAEIEGFQIPVADLKKVAEQINLNSVAGMRE